MRKRLPAVALLLAWAAFLMPRLPRTDPDAVAADERWESVLESLGGRSLWLVRPGKGGRVNPESRTGRRGTARPSFKPSETLRDALNPLPTETDATGAFWQRVFSSNLRAAVRDKNGKVMVSQALPALAGSAAIRASSRGTPPGQGRYNPRPQSGPAVWERPAASLPYSERHGRPTEGGAAPTAPRRESGVNFDGRGSGDGASAGRRSAAAPPVPAGGSVQTARKEPVKPKGSPDKVFDLADWLGVWAYHPPEGNLKPPSFTALKTKFPDSLPGGKVYDRGTPAPALVEHIAPPGERPDYDDWLYKDEHSNRGDKPHWHWDGTSPVFHAGKAWGVVAGGHWAWMQEADRRWWTLGDGAQRLVRHDEGWWWRTDDGWFLLKGGQPWAWRRFPEWEGQGFIHPTHGTQVVYSADASRVAVLTPGQETVVFDAASGQVLARFPPEQQGRPPLPD